MNASPKRFLVFSGLASQKPVWASNTKVPSFIGPLLPGPARARFRSWSLAGDEDRAGPGQPPVVEVVDGVVGGLQGVGLGVEGDLALGGQGHQLGQVVVGADDVADDVALGGDDLDGRDLDDPAVADHEVRPGPPGHLPGVLLGSHLADVAAGQLLDPVDVAAVGDHAVVGADRLGELEGLGAAVDNDDGGGAERGQDLDGDVAEAAGPDDHTGGARIQQGHGLADGVVGGQAGVGQGGHVGRLELGVDLDHRPGPGPQELGHAAVAVEAGEEAVDAVHVVAGPAVATEPAGRLGVEDDRVAGGDVGDGRADLVDPAGVLVAEGVGQRRVGVQLVPLAQVEVDVGPAHARPADLDDHVVGALDLRLLDLVN